MFLSAVTRRNPRLVDAAIKLHQSGEILPNTYVIDLEAVRKNARAIREAADRLGISLYAMTKQFGRNPVVMQAVADSGIPKAVAVDADEALVLASQGIALGHVGHLVQLPDAVLKTIMRYHPEVITVFSLDKACKINGIAAELNIIQPLLLRVRSEEDFQYPAQEGGFLLNSLPSVVSELNRLKHVRIAGVTSFPCLLFDYDEQVVKATPNLDTISTAEQVLEHELKTPLEQVNGPSVSCVATLEMLADKGVTHAEPGSALIGMTPLHAFTDQPELPAMVYVSEVSHSLDDRWCFFGGGLYPRGRVEKMLVMGADGERREVEASFPPAQAIDYYGYLETQQAKVGDTVVGSFRSQVFVSRSQVAVVDGLSADKPEIVGIFDHLGYPVRS